MTLGENIYRYRTERNWSQGDLAEALDVSRQSISKWENNLAAPDLDKLIKLHTVFNVTLDELVLGEVPNEPPTPIEVPIPPAEVSVPAPDPDPDPEPIALPDPTPAPPQVSTVSGVPVNILTMRHVIGFALLLFGLIFFLLSIFWGSSRYFSEEVGELTSSLIVLISLFILAPYNTFIISVCGIVYVIYSILCFAIFEVDSILNGIFLTIASFIILIWFIVCGLHKNKKQ